MQIVTVIVLCTVVGAANFVAAFNSPSLRPQSRWQRFVSSFESSYAAVPQLKGFAVPALPNLQARQTLSISAAADPAATAAGAAAPSSAALSARQRTREVVGLAAFGRATAPAYPGEVVVAALTSPACYSCRMIKRKIFAWLQGEGLPLPVRFVIVDLTDDRNSKIEAEFGVEQMPAFLVYKESARVDAFVATGSQFPRLLERLSEHIPGYTPAKAQSRADIEATPEKPPEPPAEANVLLAAPQVPVMKDTPLAAKVESQADIDEAKGPEKSSGKEVPADITAQVVGVKSMSTSPRQTDADTSFLVAQEAEANPLSAPPSGKKTITDGTRKAFGVKPWSPPPARETAPSTSSLMPQKTGAQTMSSPPARDDTATSTLFPVSENADIKPLPPPPPERNTIAEAAQTTVGVKPLSTLPAKDTVTDASKKIVGGVKPVAPPSEREIASDASALPQKKIPHTAAPTTEGNVHLDSTKAKNKLTPTEPTSIPQQSQGQTKPREVQWLPSLRHLIKGEDVQLTAIKLSNWVRTLPLLLAQLLILTVKAVPTVLINLGEEMGLLVLNSGVVLRQLATSGRDGLARLKGADRSAAVAEAQTLLLAATVGAAVLCNLRGLAALLGRLAWAGLTSGY